MATIFTFSTTGNCLYLANQIAKDINAKVVSMTSNVTQCDDDVIGFVFPVYFMGLPKTVKSFVERLTITNKAPYLFTVFSYGGNCFGGVAGALNSILQKKNFKLNYATKIKDVENYLPMFDVNDTKEVHDNVEKNLVSIKKDIAQKKENKIPCYSFWAKLIYSTYPAKNDGTCAQKFTVNNCSGCGVCQSVCPMNNINIIENKVTFGTNCQLCLACLHICSQNAINWNGKTEGKAHYKNPNVSKQELISFLKGE